MSYSSDNVKTKLLEPQSFNNTHSVMFKIEEPVLSNMRLVDLGAHSSGATTFNLIGGAKGIIRNMSLYAGQTKLSGCDESSDYQAFRNYNNANSINRNLDRITTLHSQGYNVSENRLISNQPLTANNIDTVANDNNLSKAWLSVGDFCPLLRAVNVIEPEMFGGNLRLEIEFNTDSQYWESNVGTSYDITRPRLVVDCVYDYNKMTSPVVWNEIESDRFTTKLLDKTVTSNDVLTSAKLNAFNNKNCGRMVMVKNYADKSKNVVGGAVVGAGVYASFGQVREKEQVVVNGVQQLPKLGCDSSAKRLQLLNDTWGACNSLLGTQNTGNQVQRLRTEIQPLQGQLSYFGMNIGQRVQDLVINLTRTGVIDNAANTPTNDPLMCTVYMEVQKALTLDGNGNFTLQYT